MLRYVFNIENNRTIKGYGSSDLKEKIEAKRSSELIFADVLETLQTDLGLMGYLKLYYHDGETLKLWFNLECDNPLKIIDTNEVSKYDIPLELFNGMFNS